MKQMKAAKFHASVRLLEKLLGLPADIEVVSVRHAGLGEFSVTVVGDGLPAGCECAPDGRGPIAFVSPLYTLTVDDDGVGHCSIVSIELVPDGEMTAAMRKLEETSQP